MLDFDVKRCTRRCSVTDRELREGETFYSALVPVGSDVERRDYCEDAWRGPPDDAIGWWQSRIPDRHARRAQLAPNDVLLDYFVGLQERGNRPEMCYVLALLLVRRRVLRMEETSQEETPSDTLVLYCPRDESTYHVPVVVPDEARIAAIQDELAQLLFSDAT